MHGNICHGAHTGCSIVISVFAIVILSVLGALFKQLDAQSHCDGAEAITGEQKRQRQRVLAQAWAQSELGDCVNTAPVAGPVACDFAQTPTIYRMW
ncbi:hypothetical protein ANO11243_089530 [Dothideomycetidae sp. 11243]|nr:hypothetical protein ANO11243_089530 [fungal sp. No.11243]